MGWILYIINQRLIFLKNLSKGSALVIKIIDLKLIFILSIRLKTNIIQKLNYLFRKKLISKYIETPGDKSFNYI